MMHMQDNLGLDAKIRIHEEFIGFVDRTSKCIFDWQQPVSDDIVDVNGVEQVS
jgi:hypothetical protein